MSRTCRGRGHGSGRTTGAGRERGGGWRRCERRKGYWCCCQSQNRQRYAKSKRMWRLWRLLSWYFIRFWPSCSSWSISVRQLSTTTWCLKPSFTTGVASLAQLPNAHTWMHFPDCPVRVDKDRPRLHLPEHQAERRNCSQCYRRDQQSFVPVPNTLQSQQIFLHSNHRD